MGLSPIFAHDANQPITGTPNWIFSFSCLSPHFFTFLAWEFLPNKWLASPPSSQAVLSEEHKLRQWLLYFTSAWLLTLVVHILSNNPSLLFTFSYKDLLIFSSKCHFPLSTAHLTVETFIILFLRYCVGFEMAYPLLPSKSSYGLIPHIFSSSVGLICHSPVKNLQLPEQFIKSISSAQVQMHFLHKILQPW